MLFGIPESENPNLYILGVPWDGSSSYRVGAALGPNAIREATSGRLYNSFTEGLVNLAERYSYRDLGNVGAETFGGLVGKVEKIVAEHYGGELFLFLGGDHAITYATFRAMRKARGRDFGLLYFDAHPDMYAEYDGNPYSHACTVRRLVEEGIVRGESVVQIGIRAPTREQLEFAEEQGISIITASDVWRGEEIELPFEEAYLSFDMDVLDPAFAPGVGNPEPSGLSTRELVEMVRGLNVEVVAFDIVELNPKYDCSGITAFAAAKIVREVLGKAKR